MARGSPVTISSGFKVKFCVKKYFHRVLAWSDYSADKCTVWIATVMDMTPLQVSCWRGKFLPQRRRLRVTLLQRLSKLVNFWQNSYLVDIQNKHHDVFICHDLIKVDFLAIKVPVFWIKIKVVSTENIPLIGGCRCQLGQPAQIMQNNSWSYGVPIGMVFLIPINLASGAAVAWCSCAQRGSWSGSYSPSQLTKSYTSNGSWCIGIKD